MFREYSQRNQKVIYDKKWRLLMQRSWLFRYVPFVEAVLGAGSLAAGNVKESSDLDVLVLARTGRIFTARFFSIVAFGLAGWRRSKLDHKEAATDKICLNHFVTPEAYEFSLPVHDYWKVLYRGLVPVYGSESVIEAFFKANEDWTGLVRWQTDSRFLYRSGASIKRLLEAMLTGAFGAWFERFIKAFQVRRIEQGMGAQEQARTIQFGSSVKGKSEHLQPLIKYTDTELEFHPEPAVLEAV